MSRDGVIARWVGRPVFWVVVMTVLVAVPLGRSVVRTLPPLPPRLGHVQLPAGAPANRLVIVGRAGDLEALTALHRRLARLGDQVAIVVVGDTQLPPGRSPRVWQVASAAPGLPLEGALLLVDATGELRGRFAPTDGGARDALVAAVGRLVNDY